MRVSLWLSLAATLVALACGPSVDVQQEREALLAVDREWSASAGDVDGFMSFLAEDASVYPPASPLMTGHNAIRPMFSEMAAAPDFNLQWTPTRADVSADGNLGHTVGTYQMTMNGATERGKYVTLWRKVDGAWKVTDDIFNADAGPAPAPHVMVAPASITWVDPPPSLPPGSKVAVISGDPSKAEPFVLRAQVPAGYRVAPHWHPGDENLTILSGTVALGMGETWDDSKLQTLASGGYAALPAEMRHFFLARTASTFQVHGMGPFVVNYVNPADDPSQKK